MSPRTDRATKRSGWAALAATGLLLVTGCTSDEATSPEGPSATSTTASTEGEARRAPVGDWPVVDPESQGIDAALLDEARAYAFEDGRNTQGVVVVHNGEIVGEWYAPGEDADSWATSWSVAKSMVSALVGIAIDDGLIEGVDTPMTTWFPDWEGTPREKITLRDVLHMESGIAWVEDYDPEAAAQSNIAEMVIGESDHLAYAAGLPSAVDPGTEFNYSSGDTMLLSGVLEQATGMPVDEYAQTELFDPLGIDQVEWWRDQAGHSLTYCCVDTTSRDFARFGQLFLDEGAWGDEQVVPQDWVEASIRDTAETSDGYGYQWWLELSDDGPLPPLYAAEGVDGQFVYIIPSADLVVVRNGTYDKTECPLVADPSLLICLPNDGLLEGRGTLAPDSWDWDAFLGPIVEAVSDS